MIKINTISGILVLSIFLIGSVYAQDQKIADEVLQRLTTQLDLSPKQILEIRPIIINNIAKRQMMVNTMRDQGVLKTQLAQSVQTETQEINKFLNKNQKNILNYLTEQELNRHKK